MKKTKSQKGITLIALIITIIVLLILAVVAIGAVQNDGVIDHTKNARQQYEKAQKNEQTTLDDYLAKLEENNPNNIRWTQHERVVTNGTIKLNVGDTVNYDETKDGAVTVPVDTEWKVLGAENGRILLLSTKNVAHVTLSGVADYKDNVGIDKLNAACAEYAQGTGAKEARSIKLEDFERIKKFEKESYGEGQVYQYGNVVTYTLGEDGDTLTYTVEGKPELTGIILLSSTESGFFMKPDGTYLQPGEVYTGEKNNFFTFDSDSYLPDKTEDPAYVMLFKDAYKYWMANKYIKYGAGEGAAIFGYAGIDNSVSVNVNSSATAGPGRVVVFSKGEFAGTGGVRAVVSLDTNVKLTTNGTNSWKM